MEKIPRGTKSKSGGPSDEIQMKNEVIGQSAGNTWFLNSHTGWGEVCVYNEYAILNPTFPAICT